ncbi:hypothetical protein [Endozoicomonas ascidiicola]|uniref:hypothetical protein n=1 Tax=Endozoicomonas ascidiicola TaxID=1698521 RepID=UPI0012F8A1B4|nr:hypothetical protein [Endozoicomonas ascidiicola]
MISDNFGKQLLERNILVVRPVKKVAPENIEKKIESCERDAQKTFYRFEGGVGRLHDRRLKDNLDPLKFAEAGWMYSPGWGLNCNYYTAHNQHGRIGISQTESAFITDFDSGQLQYFDQSTTKEDLERLHGCSMNRSISCKDNYVRNLRHEMPLLVNADGEDISGPLYQLCGPSDIGCSKAFLLSHAEHPINKVSDERRRDMLHEAKITSLEDMLAKFEKEGNEGTPAYDECLQEYIQRRQFKNILQEVEDKLGGYTAQLIGNQSAIGEIDKPYAEKLISTLSMVDLKQYLTPLICELAGFEKTFRLFKKIQCMNKEVFEAGIQAMTAKSKEVYYQ